VDAFALGMHAIGPWMLLRLVFNGLMHRVVVKRTQLACSSSFLTFKSPHQIRPWDKRWFDSQLNGRDNENVERVK